MAKRISNKVWGVVFQKDVTNMLSYVSEYSPQPLAIFEHEGEADRYRLKLVKTEPKFNRNYKVVTCILNYVEPTPKKYG